jgi:hypothetical protein
MEQMADGGCILITRDTYAGAKQFVEVVPLGMLTTVLLHGPLSGAHGDARFVRRTVAANKAHRAGRPAASRPFHVYNRNYVASDTLHISSK